LPSEKPPRVDAGFGGLSMVSGIVGSAPFGGVPIDSDIVTDEIDHFFQAV
jgi:hypothetical protein